MKLAILSLLSLVSSENLMFLLIETPQRAPKVTKYANGSNQKMIGYFFSESVKRNYLPADIPADKVDVINYAFANVSNEGTVELGNEYLDTL